MKTRRIKMNTGDVFLAPFKPDKALYNKEWDWQWEPKKNEECFLMQNIGMENGNGNILTALFDEIYHYGVDTDNIDTSKLKVIAIVDVIPVSFTVGEFKKVDNQLIPENMPYMAYCIPHIPINYITPTSSRSKITEYKGSIDMLQRAGSSFMGAHLYHIANYLIHKKNTSNYHKDFFKEMIEDVKVRPEAAVHKFFPEAKNDPNWVISQYNDPKLQDREKYEK